MGIGVRVRVEFGLGFGVGFVFVHERDPPCWVPKLYWIFFCHCAVQLWDGDKETRRWKRRGKDVDGGNSVIPHNAGKMKIFLTPNHSVSNVFYLLSFRILLCALLVFQMQNCHKRYILGASIAGHYATTSVQTSSPSLAFLLVGRRILHMGQLKFMSIASASQTKMRFFCGTNIF